MAFATAVESVELGRYRVHPSSGTPSRTSVSVDGRAVAVATHAHSVNKVRNLKLGTTLHELVFAEMDDPDLRRITEPPCAVVNVTPLRREVVRGEG